MAESNPLIDQCFEEAIELRDAGDLANAVEKLKEALGMDPKHHPTVLLILGDLYHSQKDFNKARECQQETVRLSPDSELASLSLFHTLWDMGDKWAAFREAKRFLSRHDSKEYFLMIGEMRDAFRDAGIDVKPSSSWRSGN
jgi:tetratricopeptide (TPR) repeat protein